MEAFRTEWAKNVMEVADNAVSLDAYRYFENKQKGGKFKCLWGTYIYFRSPQNLKEHLNKSSRFQNSKLEMRSYSRFQNLDSEYRIPIYPILFASIEQLMTRPIELAIYSFIHLYTRLLKQPAAKCLTPLWEVETSTKQIKFH